MTCASSSPAPPGTDPRCPRPVSAALPGLGRLASSPHDLHLDPALPASTAGPAGGHWWALASLGFPACALVIRTRPAPLEAPGLLPRPRLVSSARDLGLGAPHPNERTRDAAATLTPLLLGPGDTVSWGPTRCYRTVLLRSSNTGPQSLGRRGWLRWDGSEMHGLQQTPRNFLSFPLLLQN